VSVYLDASALIPLFTLDAFSAKASARLADLADQVLVSDFASAEFASVVARRVRARDLTAGEARAAFDTFDDWSAQHAVSVATTSAEISACAGYLRRLDVTLRAPDALHLAIAVREGARFLTFDKQLTTAAKKLGVALA